MNRKTAMIIFGTLGVAALVVAGWFAVNRGLSNHSGDRRQDKAVEPLTNRSENIEQTKSVQRAELLEKAELPNEPAQEVSDEIAREKMSELRNRLLAIEMPPELIDKIEANYWKATPVERRAFLDRSYSFVRERAETIKELKEVDEAIARGRVLLDRMAEASERSEERAKERRVRIKQLKDQVHSMNRDILDLSGMHEELIKSGVHPYLAAEIEAVRRSMYDGLREELIKSGIPPDIAAKIESEFRSRNGLPPLNGE